MTKGDNWMRNRLRKGREKIMREVETQRFDFRRFDARLVEPNGSQTDGAQFIGDLTATREKLTASIVVDLLSVRVRARDLRQHGKLMECYLSGRVLRRLVVRGKPTREGISHDRYSVVIGYLCWQGLAEPDGRSGYQWTEPYASMRGRAEWLELLMRTRGELLTARYEYTDD